MYVFRKCKMQCFAEVESNWNAVDDYSASGESFQQGELLKRKRRLRAQG